MPSARTSVGNKEYEYKGKKERAAKPQQAGDRRETGRFGDAAVAVALRHVVDSTAALRNVSTVSCEIFLRLTDETIWTAGRPNAEPARCGPAEPLVIAVIARGFARVREAPPMRLAPPLFARPPGGDGIVCGYGLPEPAVPPVRRIDMCLQWPSRCCSAKSDPMRSPELPSSPVQAFATDGANRRRRILPHRNATGFTDCFTSIDENVYVLSARCPERPPDQCGDQR